MSPPPAIDWPVPAAFPSLKAEDIHLWCAWLDDPRLTGPAVEMILAPDERTRAHHFHFAVDRRRSIAARLVLRHLLGGYLGIEPAAVQFTYGPYGKPALVPPAAVQFNLSHADPMALLAFTPTRPVGVDLEQLRDMPDLPLLEERLFPAEGRGATLPRPQSFYRRWTQMEAAGKYWGTGLQLDSVALLPAQIQEADPAEGFIGCVAYDGPPAQLKCFHATPEILFAPPENTAPPSSKLPALPHRTTVSPPLSSG